MNCIICGEEIIEGEEASLFNTGAAHRRCLKAQPGKPPLCHVLKFPAALSGLAKALEYGEKKHGGFAAGSVSKSEEEVISKILRHLSAHVNGEKIDPESGLRHLDLVTANAVMLAEK